MSPAAGKVVLIEDFMGLAIRMARVVVGVRAGAILATVGTKSHMLQHGLNNNNYTHMIETWKQKVLEN